MPLLRRKTSRTARPEAEGRGWYSTLGRPMQGDRIVGTTLSWDCLCRRCGFSFVLTSDLAAGNCPLALRTWSEEAAAESDASQHPTPRPDPREGCAPLRSREAIQKGDHP